MNFFETVKKRIRGVGRRTGLMDDFEWSSYNEKEYAKQVHDLEQQYTFVLPDGKFSIVNGKIALAPGFLPLNEYHQALYEAILALKPASVMEVGYGCGDHLHNIKKLLPDVTLRGVDLLATQLDFLKKRHPELPSQAELFIQDMAMPLTVSKKAELAYTQAVLMHIQRHGAYVKALKNTFRLAEKYVVLAENWTRHNFFNDVQKISNDADFPWKQAHCYCYDGGRQIAFVISAEPLQNFTPVNSNSDLLKYL